MIRKLTKAEVPDGSKILVVHDVHIPHHDEAACRLVVECAEHEGVTHVVADGDIHDCGISSRHPNKKARDAIDLGRLIDSAGPGRWLIDWMMTRSPNVWMLHGNHERWIEDKINEDPALAGAVTVEDLLGLPNDGCGWETLDSESRLRLGSLVIEHGHGMFPSGTGGQNPGQRMKQVAPNQTTYIGHLHRKFGTWWTTQNEDGVRKTHAGLGGGHLSIEESHASYAGGYPGWQQSVAFIRVWWDGDRPRFTIDQPEIHRDKRNRPVMEYAGKVYR